MSTLDDLRLLRKFSFWPTHGISEAETAFAFELEELRRYDVERLLESFKSVIRCANAVPEQYRASPEKLTKQTRHLQQFAAAVERYLICILKMQFEGLPYEIGGWIRVEMLRLGIREWTHFTSTLVPSLPKADTFQANQALLRIKELLNTTFTPRLQVVIIQCRKNRAAYTSEDYGTDADLERIRFFASYDQTTSLAHFAPSASASANDTFNMAIPVKNTPSSHRTPRAYNGAAEIDPRNQIAQSTPMPDGLPKACSTGPIAATKEKLVSKPD